MKIKKKNMEKEMKTKENSKTKNSKRKEKTKKISFKKNKNQEKKAKEKTKDSKPTEKKKGQKVLNLMYGIIALVFILSFIVIPFAQNSNKTYVVTSGSMEPDLKVGDIVVVSKAKPEEIKVGDIITFQRPGAQMSVTHRCISIKNETEAMESQNNLVTSNETNEIYFQTKGDANEDNDTSLVPGKYLIGKVKTYQLFGRQYYVKVPRLGYVNHFCHTTTGFFLLIILPGFAIIGGELYNIFSDDTFRKDGYTLFKSSKGDYFFKKEIEGKPVSLPKGYKVDLDKNTGFPVLQKEPDKKDIQRIIVRFNGEPQQQVYSMDSDNTLYLKNPGEGSINNFDIFFAVKWNDSSKYIGKLENLSFDEIQPGESEKMELNELYPQFFLNIQPNIAKKIVWDIVYNDENNKKYRETISYISDTNDWKLLQLEEKLKDRKLMKKIKIEAKEINKIKNKLDEEEIKEPIKLKKPIDVKKIVKNKQLDEEDIEMEFKTKKIKKIKIKQNQKKRRMPKERSEWWKKWLIETEGI